MFRSRTDKARDNVPYKTPVKISDRTTDKTTDIAIDKTTDIAIDKTTDIKPVSRTALKRLQAYGIIITITPITQECLQHRLNSIFETMTMWSRTYSLQSG